MPEILFQVAKADSLGRPVIVTEEIFQQRFTRYAEGLIVRALKAEFPKLKLTPIDNSGFNNQSIYMRYEFDVPGDVNLDDVVAFFINELQRYSWVVVQHGPYPFS